MKYSLSDLRISMLLRGHIKNLTESVVKHGQMRDFLGYADLVDQKVLLELSQMLLDKGVVKVVIDCAKLCASNERVDCYYSVFNSNEVSEFLSTMADVGFSHDSVVIENRDNMFLYDLVHNNTGDVIESACFEWDLFLLKRVVHEFRTSRKRENLKEVLTLKKASEAMIKHLFCEENTETIRERKKRLGVSGAQGRPHTPSIDECEGFAVFWANASKAGKSELDRFLEAHVKYKMTFQTLWQVYQQMISGGDYAKKPPRKSVKKNKQNSLSFS